MTGSRDDKWADEDNPFLRFKENHALHRTRETEVLRVWPMEAVVMPRQPCHLCDAGFEDRASLLEHMAKEHGGLQKYRNAMLCLQSFCPHVVVGSEVRYYVSNYSTFLRRQHGLGRASPDRAPRRPWLRILRQMVLVGGAVGRAPGRRALLHAKCTCSLDALVCGSIASALAEDPSDGAASLRRPSARS